MTDPIVKIANKKVEQKDKRKARELRKALKGNKSVIVTLHTGSEFTLVTADSDTGMRFSGMRNGQPGRFHAAMIKDIQVLTSKKGDSNE
jgi:hypothetical protein